MLKKWSDLKMAMSPERRARIDAEVAKMNAEIEAAKLIHYVVIRRDLAFGEYSAQLAHAGEAYYLRCLHDRPAQDRGDATLFFNQTTCIVKGARNEAKLLKLEKQLIAAVVPHVAIREEEGERGRRIAGQLTCISLMPSNDPALRKLLNDFVEIKGLDPISSPDSSRESTDRKVGDGGSNPPPGATP